MASGVGGDGPGRENGSQGLPGIYRYGRRRAGGRSVWEGAMAASQYKLDNLCAVVDRNRLQISGNTEDVMGHDDLHERFRSFGWHVIDVKDGK